MKRSLVIVGLILVAAIAFAAEYQSRLGSRDLRWGTGSWVDNGGRTRYFINANDIPFTYDNNIKLGNTNLYNLSSGVIGNWKVLYTNGSGVLSVLSLDNAGLVFTSGGPAAAPYFGPGGGTGSYNPAAVAITGGTISGLTSLNVGTNSSNRHAEIDSGGLTIGPYRFIYLGKNSTTPVSQYFIVSPSADALTISYGGVGAGAADNVAIYSFQLNTNNTTLPATKSVMKVTNYTTKLFEILGDGSITIPGTVNMGGVGSTAANGYRRMNICNTGGVGAFLFTPQAGDLACSDNVYYVYAGGSWATLGSTGGGGDNTVVKFSVTDNFNRTNADPEGNDWTTSTGSRDVKISGNTLMMGAGGSGTNALAFFDNAATFANNQYSQMKINTLGQGAPAVRVQSGSESAYLLDPTSTTEVSIYILNDGASTVLGAACSGTFAVSDTFKLTASGSTLTAYQNGTAISGCSRTDSTFTGGNPGVRLYGATGAADDWAGGDL